MVRSSTTATGAHGMPVTVGIVMETDERGLLRRGCPVQELERVSYAGCGERRGRPRVPTSFCGWRIARRTGSPSLPSPIG